MREIKFRAWNDRLKQMSDVTNLFSEDGCQNLKELSNFETVIMQFTGLKGKDEAEIYEADIVEIYSQQRGSSFNGYGEDDRDITWRGEVCYRPSSGFGLKRVLFMDESMDKFERHAPLKCIVQYKARVIGNIYENPELLEVK